MAASTPIRSAPGRWGNLEILDINARFDDPALLLDFNVYLSERGQAVFAEFVTDALRDVD